jgi:hypothetical protein
METNVNRIKHYEERRSVMNYREMLEQEIERLSNIQVETIEEAKKIEQEIYALTPRTKD